MRHEQHQRDKSETKMTGVQHECETSESGATYVENFNKDTTENVFLHHYISYMTNERLQEEQRYHSKNCVLEILCSYAKMSSTSALQKLNF